MDRIRVRECTDAQLRGRQADLDAVQSGFILFQGRLLGTAHIITLAPPRADGGKHIIEARVTGGVFYVEEFEDPDEAAGRYLSLCADLLDDPSIAGGVRRPASRLVEVSQLPSRD